MMSIITEDSCSSLVTFNNPVIETVNLVGRSNTKSSTLINGIDLNIQDGSSSNTIGRLSSSPLNKQGKWSCLEGKTKLGRGRWRRGVAEDTLGLGKLLVNIRYKSSRVTKCVTVLHEVIN